MDSEMMEDGEGGSLAAAIALSLQSEVSGAQVAGGQVPMALQSEDVDVDGGDDSMIVGSPVVGALSGDRVSRPHSPGDEFPLLNPFPVHARISRGFCCNPVVQI